MSWQYPPFALLLVLAGIISAALAFYAWRRRPLPGTAAFALLMAAVAVWTVTSALTVVSVDLASAAFWSKSSYLGIATVPPAWLAFALHYAGWGKWLTRRNLVLLLAIPLITIVLVWTNEAHYLIYGPFDWAAYRSGVIRSISRGPWFWVHTAYSYLLLLAGTVLLLRVLLGATRPRLYRGQATVVLVGMFAPWVINGLYLARLIPFGRLDPTPLGFTLTGLAVAWGLFSFRLLDIVPVAREAVVESMSDSVIVLDLQGRIVDLNPAAQALIGAPMAQTIGRPVVQVLHSWRDFVERYQEKPETQAEIAWERDGRRSYHDLRISSLLDRRGQLTGRLMILRDITQRVQAELQRDATLEALRQRTAELEASNQELDAFAHTAAHDLKSPLAWIVGYADLLEEDHAAMPPEELRQRLGIIAKSGRKMSAIIDELLLLSTVRKVQVIEMYPLDMADIVAQVQDRLAPMIKEYQAEILAPAKEAWPVAMGYGPWVEEVWVNYLTNALKYGGQPPRVELGFTVSASGLPILDLPSQESQSAIQNPESKIVFWVRDNGPGIAPEDQARLFTPFNAARPGAGQGARPGSIHRAAPRGKAGGASRGGESRHAGSGECVFLYSADSELKVDTARSDPGELSVVVASAQAASRCKTERADGC